MHSALLQRFLLLVLKLVKFSSNKISGYRILFRDNTSDYLIMCPGLLGEIINKRCTDKSVKEVKIGARKKRFNNKIKKFGASLYRRVGV